MKPKKIYGIYIPRYHKQSKFYQIFKNHFETFVSLYYTMDEIYQNYGDLSSYQIDTVYKFLKCQDLTEGFGLASCPQCGTSYIIPFSCKKHKICPSCRMKRLIEFSEWLKQEVLLNIKHRHIVLTIPKQLRIYFYQNRWLLNKLIETGCQMMVFIYRKQSNLSQTEKKKAHPGIVGVLQTAGNDLKWNPHCHLICTDGVMIEQGNEEDDRYIPIPFLPYDYIRISWRNRVLNMLVNCKMITDKQRDEYKKLWGKGFNIHGSIKDTYSDYEVKNRLCQYMMRAIISEKNIIYYNQNKKEVVIRYKSEQNLSSGKYQYKTEKLSVYEFIARVIQHIDDVSMNTRYYGYANLSNLLSFSFFSSLILFNNFVNFFCSHRLIMYCSL